MPVMKFQGSYGSLLCGFNLTSTEIALCTCHRKLIKTEVNTETQFRNPVM